MTLRRIAPMSMPDIVPGGADMPEPVLRRARPQDLLVDETYQRNLSERSVALIRRMVARWDWRSFQPPLCVPAAGGLHHVVDGQHTAIAAATHPAIETIPILVVEAAALAERAAAFIGRNRDRIIVTPNQLHHAAVAAGEPYAVTINRACAAAAVRVLKQPPGAASFKPGDTLAIGSIHGLLRRRGERGLRATLKVCGDAKLGPISAAIIKAVEALLFDPEYAGHADAGDLTTMLRAGGAAQAEAEARVTAASREIPHWRALAMLLAERARHGHRRAS